MTDIVVPRPELWNLITSKYDKVWVAEYVFNFMGAGPHTDIWWVCYENICLSTAHFPGKNKDEM